MTPPTPPSDVGEILKRLVATTQPYHRLDGSPPPHVLPEHYEQARSTLLALLVSRLPSKKPGEAYYQERASRETIAERFGYNQCLADTVSVLNELFAQPTNTEDK